jgi:hydroxyacylglutathione hydrolase
MTIELLPSIHLVASGRLGFSLGHPCDCNAYLLRGRETSVLIDAGCGLGTSATLAAIAEAKGPPVSDILLTHAHADHAAGAVALAERLDARIHASAAAAAMLDACDEQATGLAEARSAGIYPAEVVLVPGEPVQQLSVGPGSFGDQEIEVMESEGHARGHVCLIADRDGRRVLFSGDAVFARGRVAILDAPASDVPALADSLVRLSDAEPDALLPGHGAPALRDARAHIQIAIDAFARGALPPALQ